MDMDRRIWVAESSIHNCIRDGPGSDDARFGKPNSPCCYASGRNRCFLRVTFWACRWRPGLANHRINIP